jgi:hypothetical protein
MRLHRDLIAMSSSDIDLVPLPTPDEERCRRKLNDLGAPPELNRYEGYHLYQDLVSSARICIGGASN